MPSNNSKYTEEIREKTAKYILETKRLATNVTEEMVINVISIACIFII